MRVTRCPICTEVLFTGPSDPLERYLAMKEGWSGVPLIVCTGSWRNLWRKKWYHQACAGLYTDHTDSDGHWFIFGSHQLWLERMEAQAKRLLREAKRGTARHVTGRHPRTPSGTARSRTGLTTRALARQAKSIVRDCAEVRAVPVGLRGPVVV